MDSLTDQTMQTPNGLVLSLTTAAVVTEVSTATPIASVLSMNKTYEIGRWRIESENEGIRIYDVRFGGTNLISTNGNVTQAILKLYDGTTLKQTATRTIYGDTGVVFGNTAVLGGVYANYPASSRLNWDLAEDTAYTLALEVTIQDYASGFGAVSGDTLDATLDRINYRTLDTNNDVLSGVLGLASSTHELRRGKLSIQKTDVLKTGQVKGADREVFNFVASAEAGARRVTLRAFSLLVSGDNAKINGVGTLNVYAGSTSNPVVARLRNTALVAATAEVTGMAAGVFTFNAVHGLSVGDVFKYSTANDGALNENAVVVSLGDAVGANPTTKVTATQLDGTASTAFVANAAAVDSGPGDAVFLAEATLFIPAIVDIRITEGSSTTFIVTGDTSGTLTTSDQVNIRLDSANDIWWWDEAVGTDPINTARVSEFPVQWALRY